MELVVKVKSTFWLLSSLLHSSSPHQFFVLEVGVIRAGLRIDCRGILIVTFTVSVLLIRASFSLLLCSRPTQCQEMAIIFYTYWQILKCWKFLKLLLNLFYSIVSGQMCEKWGTLWKGRKGTEEKTRIIQVAVLSPCILCQAYYPNALCIENFQINISEVECCEGKCTITSFSFSHDTAPTSSIQLKLINIIAHSENGRSEYLEQTNQSQPCL